MGANSEQLRSRLTAEASSVKMDGDGGGVFYVKGGHVLEWERAPEEDTEEGVEGAGESPPSPCCCSANSSVGDDVVDEEEAVEIPYEEIYPTKHSDENDDGDLSSSASTEPLALSYDDSDSSRDCSDGYHGGSIQRSGDDSFDDQISEGSFSLPCVHILDFSEVADEISSGAFERQHDGVEIEFSPDYFSDASTEGESQQGIEEEEESLQRRWRRHGYSGKRPGGERAGAGRQRRRRRRGQPSER